MQLPASSKRSLCHFFLNWPQVDRRSPASFYQFGERLLQILIAFDPAVRMIECQPRSPHSVIPLLVSFATRIIVCAGLAEYEPLAEKSYPTRHTSIGSIIDAGLRIHAFCLDCRHDEDLDLDRVAERLGRDFSSLPAYLVPKLVCSQCGSKNVGMVLAPADQGPGDGQVEHLRERWKRD